MNLASGVRRMGPTRTPFKYTQPSVDEPIASKRWVRLVNETKEMIADPEVNTIVCDGLGVLSQYLIDHILGAAVDSATSKVKTVGLTGERVAQMEIQHYGDFARLLRMYVMMVRSSGKYFVMTSHQSGDADEVTKVVRYVLAIPVSLRTPWAVYSRTFGQLRLHLSDWGSTSMKYVLSLRVFTLLLVRHSRSTPP
jgi:hypothetical protein